MILLLSYMFIPHLLLVAFNLCNSRLDAFRILQHKTIAHGVNFGCYLIFTGLLIPVFDMGIETSIYFILSAFFNRQVTFDIPLNLRRGKRWDYVSLDRPPKAWWDRVEIRIFGYNGKLSVALYFSLWLVFMILYLLHGTYIP